MTSFVIQESNDSKVPVTRALLKANPALHSALLKFETSQLKLERAYVVPFVGRPKLGSSSSSEDDLHRSDAKAVAARDPLSEAMARRASLWSQDSDDESSEDGSDVWGDDEDDSSSSGSSDSDSDSDSEWSAGEEDEEAAAEEDVRVIPRGRRLLRTSSRSRSRSPVPAPAPTASDADTNQMAVPTASLPRFSQPPLPASFVLRIPEGRRWRRSTPSTPDLLASSPIEPTSSASSFSSCSSSSAYSLDRSPRFEPLTRQFERDDDEVTLFDEAEVRTEDTAVDLDEAWERAMRFSGWIRRPSQTSEAEEELGRWEYKGRKDRASLGARQGVVEGLRRLVEMVQA